MAVYEQHVQKGHSKSNATKYS